MADITLCVGTECPIKDTCKRFTTAPYHSQSWFMETPGKIKDGKFSCEMYWGQQAEVIMNQLKEIIK